jgi:hypothetical protein
MDDGGSFLACVWRDSSPLVESTLVLLILMFFWTLVEIVERGLRYRAAFRQTRHFLKTAVGFLENGDWDSALGLAERSKRSHVATVFASGLREFRKARAGTSIATFGRNGSACRAHCYEPRSRTVASRSERARNHRHYCTSPRVVRHCDWHPEFFSWGCHRPCNYSRCPCQ